MGTMNLGLNVRLNNRAIFGAHETISPRTMSFYVGLTGGLLKT